jgi:hypothetical protein
MSHIRLSLGYEKLTDNGRGTIWDNLFKKLGDDHKRGGPEINYEYHAKSYVKSPDVQALEWNDREIRNGKLPDTAFEMHPTDPIYRSFPNRCRTGCLRRKTQQKWGST